MTVRSRSVFGTVGTELCEKTRFEAFDMMLDHAKEIGANAVLGVRYDATEVMGGVTEVCAAARRCWWTVRETKEARL